MKFKRGNLVRKVKGSSWHGRVVGEYSTELTHWMPLPAAPNDKIRSAEWPQS